MDRIARKEPGWTGKELKDIKVLALFTEVYCKAHHSAPKEPLGENVLEVPARLFEKYRFCPECRELLEYAVSRRRRCPLDPKPACKHCHVHCYRTGHREKVREIMRFSGQRLIKRGRLDLLWHYFF